MTAEKTPDPNDTSAATLDENLAELEALVESMESGDLPLDEAMQRFERGIELTRRCQKALADAEQKVEVLLKKNGAEPTLEPFEDD